MKPCKRSPDCDGMLGNNSKNEFCQKCRNSDKKWSKRRPKDVLARHRMLRVWDLRLAPHLPDVVTHIHTKSLRRA